MLTWHTSTARWDECPITAALRIAIEMCPPCPKTPTMMMTRCRAPVVGKSVLVPQTYTDGGCWKARLARSWLVSWQEVSERRKLHGVDRWQHRDMRISAPPSTTPTHRRLITAGSYRLLEQAVITDPTPYMDIIGGGPSNHPDNHTE